MFGVEPLHFYDTGSFVGTNVVVKGTANGCSLVSDDGEATFLVYPPLPVRTTGRDFGYRTIPHLSLYLMNDPLAFKKSAIAQFIQRKATALEQLKADQQARLRSANTDDIDKQNLYESPKEEMMDEIEQKAEPVDAMDDEVRRLRTIDLHEAHETVAFGSLVRTNQAYFLIAAAQDAFTYDDKTFIGLSAQAPLFDKMEGLQKGAEFHYGDIEYVILDIV